MSKVCLKWYDALRYLKEDVGFFQIYKYELESFNHSRRTKSLNLRAENKPLLLILILFLFLLLMTLVSDARNDNLDAYYKL